MTQDEYITGSCPMNGVAPPFTLPSNIVYFHDWRYVDHSYLRWLDAAGQPVQVMPAPTPLPPMHASAEWLPRGVRIETVPGEMDAEPALRAAEIGEKLFFGGSVIREHGGYRLFYESIKPGDVDPNHAKVMRCAESDDGRHWRFPKYGRTDVDGSRDNNAVFDPGAAGFHGAGVFKDVHGPEAERYKALWLCQVSLADFARYAQQWPGDIDPLTIYPEDHAWRKQGRAAWGVAGAVSPDGLRWTMLPDPLMIQHSDTFNACTFDPYLRKYVFYPRTWYYGHRSIGRATSGDFRHFSGLQQVIWPGPDMRATDTWYTPGYTRMPGAPDYQLMFATLWSQLGDTFQPILHSSPDGVVWNRVPGQPMLPFGPTGSWHACGAAVTTLVDLPDDRIGSLVMGWHVPHKYPRAFPGFGQAGWVRWRRGRLTALRAGEDAVFTLYPLRVKGRRMILNFRSGFAGSLRVGVRGKDWYRRIEDCDIVMGDELDRVVTWKGESDLGHSDGESLQFCFQLRMTDLFSVRFE